MIAEDARLLVGGAIGITAACVLIIVYYGITGWWKSRGTES